MLTIIIIKIINIKLKNGQKHYKVTKAVDITANCSFVATFKY